jgi:hypothetical protein
LKQDGFLAAGVLMVRRWFTRHPSAAYENDSSLLSAPARQNSAHPLSEIYSSSLFVQTKVI